VKQTTSHNKSCSDNCDRVTTLIDTEKLLDFIANDPDDDTIIAQESLKHKHEDNEQSAAVTSWLDNIIRIYFSIVNNSMPLLQV